MPPKKSATPSEDTKSKDLGADVLETEKASVEPIVATRRSTRVASNALAQTSSDSEKVAALQKGKKVSGPAVKDLEAKLRATTLGSEDKPKPKPQARQQKEYLNPLPSPPAFVRPAPVLYAWGAGNAGQFGMGVEMLGELSRPTRNKLVEKMAGDGKFGGQGAGLESVAAGGMSSLFVDEQGTVIFSFFLQ